MAECGNCEFSTVANHTVCSTHSILVELRSFFLGAIKRATTDGMRAKCRERTRSMTIIWKC